MWLLDRHICFKVQTLTLCTFKMLKGCVIIDSCKTYIISYLVYSIFALTRHLASQSFDHTTDPNQNFLVYSKYPLLVKSYHP